MEATQADFDGTMRALFTFLLAPAGAGAGNQRPASRGSAAVVSGTEAVRCGGGASGVAVAAFGCALLACVALAAAAGAWAAVAVVPAWLAAA